jgi:hypothetical protein
VQSLNVSDSNYKRILKLVPSDQYRRLLSSLRGEIDVEL